MRSITDNLRETAGEIENLIRGLLLDHTSIYRWNTPGGELRFITGTDYAYRSLDEEGLRIQSRVLTEYRHFHELIRVLLQVQSESVQEELATSDRKLSQTIELKHTWCKSTPEALDWALGALAIQVNLLAGLYDSSEGMATFVPDTNALLHNTALEKWSFDDTPRFTLVLLPVVLSELDSLKVNHRNESVRDKSEKMIRQIKEYRRRGSLANGVPILKGKSQLEAIAKEPNTESSLEWFDMSNNDDRFLAGVVDLMRSRPRSPVLIVTRDINLQNKAEFARIPFLEPPEPN
jgi:hypothetical protein